MKSHLRSFLMVLFLGISVSIATAQLKLPAIFGDNMVLQQQQRIPIWGWASPGVEVQVSFAGQTRTARTSPDGKWRVEFRPLRASFTPQTLSVRAGETRTLTNILIGEVWLASGQSNMEKPIGNQPGQRPTFDAEAELAAANFPAIRIFKVDRTLAAVPQDDLTKFQPWQECSSNALNAASFSAAAYFFGRDIHTNLNVPIGLVESSWGGTRIEPWTPPVGFKKIPALKALAEPTDLGTNKISNRQPMAIYNAMIAPLAGFALRGALWYQGESNLGGTNSAHARQDYDVKMAALIGGWREVWQQGDFPFFFVQIAPFRYFSGKTRRTYSVEALPEFWETQSRAARAIKNTGMVVTTDLVDDLNDIHPRNKKDVGRRLALLALEETYDREIESRGPTFHRATFGKGKVVLRFDHAESGLRSRNGLPLTDFTIAGADGKFVPASAQIVENKIEVMSPEVAAPRAVRFAWHESAQPNLVNGAGLPAEPFRTDAPRR